MHNPPELPKPKIVEKGNKLNSKACHCPKCGALARIVSNDLGIQAYCGPCGIDWPISNPAIYEGGARLPPRGLHKVSGNYHYDFDERGH